MCREDDEHVQDLVIYPCYKKKKRDESVATMLVSVTTIHRKFSLEYLAHQHTLSHMILRLTSVWKEEIRINFLCLGCTYLLVVPRLGHRSVHEDVYLSILIDSVVSLVCI